MVLATGIPAEQDTIMVTEFAVELNVTRAVGTGPRITVPASYPGSGLHDTRYAPPVRQSATTVPPGEVRTVEVGLALAVALGEAAGRDVLARADGESPVCGRTVDDSRARCERVPDGAGLGALVVAGPAPGVSSASAASARLTAAVVSCCDVLVAMPWPSSETASKLLAVAAPTPSIQAPTPAKTRMCTGPGSPMHG